MQSEFRKINGLTPDCSSTRETFPDAGNCWLPEFPGWHRGARRPIFTLPCSRCSSPNARRAISRGRSAPFRVPAGRRPAAGDRRIVRGARTRRARPGAARRHRLGQDLYDGACHRAHRPPGDHPGAEQDPGGAALRRDEELLPGERGRVFRLLLRLLPARGLRPAHRHLCREGIVAERADRPDAPLGDPGDPRTARCRRRRVGLLHLRHRLGRDLFADDRVAGSRRPGQPHQAAGEVRRTAIPAQRPQFLPRHVPGARRHDRAVPGALRGPRLAHLAVRRRDRGDPRDRSADRREDRGAALGQGLRQQPLRDAAPDPAAGDRADPARPQDPPRRVAPQGKLLEAQRLEQRTQLRHRDDRGDRLLRRHRELFALSDRPQARASRRRPFSNTCRATRWSSSTRAMSRCRSSAACSAATGRARRRLAEYGFRLPSCTDNRPLKFEEWDAYARPDDLCLGHPGPLGDGARRRRLRRADRAADRPRRSALHHPPDRKPGRRSDGRVPRGGRARASACWSRP